MMHDGSTAHTFEVIYRANVPTFGFGVGAGAPFVVFGTFTTGLIFGGNSDPDADVFD